MPFGGEHHLISGVTAKVATSAIHHISPNDPHHISPNDPHHISPNDPHHISPNDPHHISPNHSNNPTYDINWYKMRQELHLWNLLITKGNPCYISHPWSSSTYHPFELTGVDYITSQFQPDTMTPSLLTSLLTPIIPCALIGIMNF